MISLSLKKILKSRKISVAELHDITGISRSTLNSMVNGSTKGIQFDTLDSLCFHLELQPSDLIEYAEPTTEPEIAFKAYTSSKDEKLYSLKFIYKYLIGKKETFIGLETVMRKINESENGETFYRFSIHPMTRYTVIQLLQKKGIETYPSMEIHGRREKMVKASNEETLSKMIPKDEKAYLEVLPMYMQETIDIIQEITPSFFSDNKVIIFNNFLVNNDNANYLALEESKVFKKKLSEEVDHFYLRYMFETETRNNQIFVKHNIVEVVANNFGQINKNEIHFLDN